MIRKQETGQWDNVFYHDRNLNHTAGKSLVFDNFTKNYQVIAIPYMILIDRNGMVAEKSRGYSKEEIDHLDSLINTQVSK